jgi:hypothetical protein
LRPRSLQTRQLPETKIARKGPEGTARQTQNRARILTEAKQAEETKKERRLEREIEIKESIEVQAWLSAFSVPSSQVEDFGKKWQRRLHEIFQE